MKVRILYHSHCIDGIVAAWIAWYAHTQQGHEVVAEARSYNRPAIDLSTRYDLIEVIDFSFSPDVLTQLKATCDRVVLLDHHESARKMLEGFVSPGIDITMDMGRSGALLAYDHHKLALPSKWVDGIRRMAVHVDDRDRWVFALPASKAFNRTLSAHHADPVQKFHEWVEDSNVLTASGFDNAVAEGHVLVASDDARVQQAKTHAWEVEFEGLVVPVVNVPLDIVSTTCHELAKAHPSKMALGFLVTADGIAVSLRSADDGPDVAAMATRWGGGGHVHASGFKLGFSDAHRIYPT